MILYFVIQPRPPVRSIFFFVCFSSFFLNNFLFFKSTPPTVRPFTMGPRVLVGLPLPLRFGLGGCLLLARRGWAGFMFIRHYSISVFLNIFLTNEVGPLFT